MALVFFPSEGFYDAQGAEDFLDNSHCGLFELFDFAGTTAKAAAIILRGCIENGRNH